MFHAHAAAATFTVTSAADSGAGTLRQALADAAASAGSDVIAIQAPVTTIIPASSLSVNDPAGVIIEGAGATLDGAGMVRLISNAAGSKLTLKSLNITGGDGGNAAGGAISNSGELTLEGCALYGNTSGTAGGGAVNSQGSGSSLVATNCTFTSNTGDVGGAIRMSGSTLTLTHCTVTQNHGTKDISGSGGVQILLNSVVTITNSLIAGNTAAGTSVPDLNGGNSTFTLGGVNLIGVRSGGFQNFLPAGTPNVDGHFVGTLAAPVPARLGPLQWNGGAVPTMDPELGSLALNRLADGADIGAAESRKFLAEGAWDVRMAGKTGVEVTSLATAEALLADPAAYHARHTADRIAFGEGARGGNFVSAHRAWPEEGVTDDFAFVARTYISIAEQDDYTFGFAGDEGGRLRLFSTTTAEDPVLAGNLSTVHLLPGVYGLEFLTWENTGGSHAEVYAARGMKTSVDASFRLIGDRSAPLRLDHGTVYSAGWALDMHRASMPNFDQSIENVANIRASNNPAVNLRFSSGSNSPAADPATFVLEASISETNLAWVTVMTGNTQIPVARNTAGPLIAVPGHVAYSAYRFSFPTVRDAAAASTPQPGGVEILDVSLSNFITSDWVRTDLPNGGFSLVNTNAIHQTGLSFHTQPLLHVNDPESLAAGLGHDSPVTPVPGNRSGADSNFTLSGRTVLTVPVTGDYTFCVQARGDIRFRLHGTRGWTAVSESGAPAPTLDGFQNLGADGDAFGQVRLTAGTYEVEVIHRNTSSPAHLGVWAAQGRHSRFDTATSRYFSLLGSSIAPASESAVPFLLTKAPRQTSPPNDDYADAQVLSGSRVTAFAGNAGATIEPGESTLFGAQGSVWFQWTAPSSGEFLFDTLGTQFDAALEIYTGNTLGTAVFRNGIYFGFGNAQIQEPVTAGTTYHLRVSPKFNSASRGAIQFAIRPIVRPANDNFADAADLGNGLTATASGELMDATSEDDEMPHDDTFSGGANKSVWFKWTAPRTGYYVLDDKGSTAASFTSIYTGTDLASLTKLRTTFSEPGISFPATEGVTYHFAVDAYNDGTGPGFFFNLTFVLSKIDDLTVNEDDTGYDYLFLGEYGLTRHFALSAASNNAALLPLSGVSLFENGGFRTFSVTPVANKSGTARITLSGVMDGVSVSTGFNVIVNPVNDAPVFTPGADILAGNTGPFSRTGWASSISPGPADEAGQTLQFSIVGNTNAALFLSPIVLSSTGTITFIPSGTLGSATITARLTDSGGTANEGVNFVQKTFTITVTTPYGVWAAQQFGSATQRSGPHDDFDYDGLTNLTEFAIPQLPAFSSGGFTFTRFADPSAAGVSYAVQTSTNLADWITITPTVLNQNSSAGVTTITYALPGSAARVFYRVSVEPAP